MKRITLCALMIASLALSGCSMFGGDKKAADAAERAQRVPLIASDEALSADPDRAEIAVFLPDADFITNWPQSGGSAGKEVGHRVGAYDFELDWKKSVVPGSKRKARLVAPPVSQDGTLFLFDAKQTIHAVDGTNGASLWKKKLEPVRKSDRVAQGGGIAIAKDRLIVTSGYGYIAAFDIRNGVELWRRMTQAPVTGAPTVDDNFAYITSSNNEIYVVRLGNGDIIWSDQAIAETARVQGAPSPALSSDILVAPFSSGELIAYLPANGRRLWSTSLSQSSGFTPISAINDIAGRPVLSEGAIYAASQSGVLAAIDQVSGGLRWSKPFGSIQTPAVSGQFVFAVNTDGQLACFDKNDGGVIWVTQLDQFRNEKKRKDRIVWTGPVIASGKIVLASSQGRLVSIDPQTGAVLEDLKVGDPIYVEPIIANERIYVLTDDGDLASVR